MMVEKSVLENKGVFVESIYAHPLAKITTPYDVAWNRIHQKTLKDGSCGLGVGATMSRNASSGYKLYAEDLKCEKVFWKKVEMIKMYYEDLIVKTLGTDISEKGELLGNFNLIAEEEMIHFETNYKNHPIQIKGYHHLKIYHNIIFEGSQGILLDMCHGIFPNVTYANTTSKNAIEIIKTLKISDVNTHYVTRCYQTRHGNGWISNDETLNLQNNKEEINCLNQYQGEFRVTELDYDLLNYAIGVDEIYSYGLTSKNIVVTCLDQRPGFEFDWERLKQCYFATKIISNSPESKNFKIL
jgi:adenylosuccinate synthase